MPIEFVNPITPAHVRSEIRYDLYQAQCRVFILEYLEKVMTALDGKTMTKRFEKAVEELNTAVGPDGTTYRAYYTQECSWTCFKIRETSGRTKELLQYWKGQGVRDPQEFQESMIIMYDNAGKIFSYENWYAKHLRGALECARGSLAKAQKALGTDVVAMCDEWNAALKKLQQLNQNAEAFGLQYTFDVSSR